MAGSQTLRFDIVGDGSSASRAFRQVAGDSALAARGAKQLADSLGIQSKSAQASAAATVSLAKSDGILADAEALLAGSVDEATNKLQAQGRAAEDTAARTRLAGDAAKSAGGGFGFLGTPIGAAAAAGVTLAPVLLTVGTGLAGLALAAESTVKPVLGASSAMTGLDPAQRAAYASLSALKGEFSAFGKALEPDVLGVFNQGLKLAGGLLGDAEPVAAATGKGLSSVVAAIGADLKTSQWQSFFAFMAQNAEPDIEMIGTLLVDVGTDVAVVTPLLQPLASGFLKVSAAAATTVSGGTNLFKSFLNTVAGAENQFDKLIGSAPGALPFQSEADALTALGNAARAGGPQVGTLAGDMALLNTSATDSATALSAYSDAWTKVIGGSLSDQQAILADEAAFASLTAAVKGSGGQSLAARQAFVSYMQQIGASISTLQQNGASVGAVNSEYEVNIKRLQSLHGLTPAQRADVQGLTRDYDVWANSATGLAKQTETAANVIKNDFLAQVGSVAAHVPGVSGDVSNFANSILKTGAQSSATRADRQQLIADLEKAALSAQQATSQVNALQRQVSGLHGANVPVRINLTASGGVNAVINSSGTAAAVQGGGRLVISTAGAAAGMLVTGGTTPTADDMLVRVSKGELIVPTHLVASGAADTMRGKIPGFAAGGLAGAASFAGSQGGSFAAGEGAAFAKAVDAAFAKAIAAAKAAAAAAGTPVAYSKVAGVTQWEPDVLRVLGMLGLPQADLPTVMSQILTESGGNPNAQNNSDSNAAAGTPSKGLLQVIGPTFAAYRNPSLSANIFDPEANIYAGVNYAVHRYGNPGWLSVLGHGHGYDNGGYLPPGLSLAYNGTGRPEPVVPHIPGRGLGGPVTIVFQNHGVIGSQAEVRRWLHGEIDELARSSKLTYALQRSPSAGR